MWRVRMNRTEKSIMKFYQSINIDDPLLLSVEIVTEHLSIDLIYWNETSSMAQLNDRYIVFINESLTMQQQWQEFGHEMCHYFNDKGNRNLLNSSFIYYCEFKADYFAYHFCVPTFMLQNIKGVDVYDVVNKFNVEFDFALRRLEMYHNKILTKGELQIGKRACKI